MHLEEAKKALAALEQQNQALQKEKSELQSTILPLATLIEVNQELAASPGKKDMGSQERGTF